MTTQPRITDTHTLDGAHALPDWLPHDGAHPVLPGRDDTTPPQPGWMLVRWSDGHITVASPQVAARAYGPDGMHGRLQRAEAELADHAAAESADAAAGSYARRAESAEQQRDLLAGFVRGFLDPSPCVIDHGGHCQAHLWMCSGRPCPHARAREVLAALDDEPAIAQPGRWLHVTFTSADETTANTSALNLRDHLTAEFDGIRMRITSNAVEGTPALDIPADKNGPTIANPQASSGESVDNPADNKSTPPTSRELIDTALRTTPRGDCTDWPPRTAHGGGHQYDMRCALCTGDVDALTDAVHATLQPRLAALAEARDHAQDALALVGEHCDMADILHKPITTDDVRACLKGTRCAREAAAPAPRDPCPHCEASSDRIPRADMAQHIAEQHPDVQAAERKEQQ